MKRAALRGRAAKGDALPKRIGVDEKAIAKGHQYMTLVCDLDRATVEYVGEGRKEASLAAYFQAFGTERCADIDDQPRHVDSLHQCLPRRRTGGR